MRFSFVRAAVAPALLLALFAVSEAAAPPARRPGKAAATAGGNAPLRSLSLEDRIAQLIIVRGYGDYPPSHNAEYERFVHWIRDLHVGGFIVAGRIRNGDVVPAQPFELAAFVNHVQRLAKTPLLVGSDFERGASMRVAETARFPYLMAFGAAHDPAATRELGAATAREACALGVNWVFAPDADVNNNPDNPIINTRSFGEDPQAVADGVTAFIEGAHSDPANYVLLSAKHFPGQGDTSEDTHMQLARVDQPKERIESVEFVPFRAAIAHGVDAIMTAHLAVPAFEPEAIPATVSRNILTGVLRNELGFKGIVVTDALEMQGVMSLYSAGEAAVRAIEAGTDVLLMPTDPQACIRAISAAVASGRISRARIDASVSKILAAKQKLGLYRARAVSLDSLSDEIEARQMDALAQRVADRAITLVRDDAHLFPIPAPDDTCLAVLTESDFSIRGQTLSNTLKAGGITNLRTYSVNPNMTDTLLNGYVTDMQSCKRIYAATFITVGANRGNVALKGGLGKFLTNLLAGTAPVAVVSFGSPYLLRDFQQISSYAATFSVTVTSEAAAGHAILGQIPITGKLPVSIPPIARLGDGLDVPARPKAASNGTE